MSACPSCGHRNQAGAKFCSECATALLPARGAPREERKVVTVLFADLVGFTSRAEPLDPEDVRALLSPYYARLRAEIERFGGTVEKFIGDAVMALFGAPVSHEDDPERAVRAALAIRDWALEPEGTLQLRIAVNTGEALVALHARPGEGEALASGDVVNTAARLQAAAPVNGILVGETTYRATSQVITYRDAAPVIAKGKAEPVRVWEAIEALARAGVDLTRPGRTPLIARTRELDVLSDTLTRARSDRSPQLVTVVGVPGIGKSRLVAELFRAVDDDPTAMVIWRQGRCLPYGDGVTLWALGEMVKAQCGILETDPSEAVERKLHTAVVGVVTDRAEAQWVEDHLRPLAGLGRDSDVGGGRQSEAFAAWRRFLEALAERQPTVLVFEDLQWADDNLLDFVDHLVDWASDVPLLVVCTTRPELLERRAGWGGGKRNATTLSLAALSDEETALLISSLTDGPVLRAETQQALLERAGGNPLFAEQFLRMLLEGSRDQDLPLPETVQGIIAARLDALAPEEKSLLQNAAVIGKVFWRGAVAAIGGVDHRAAELSLHALERKEFVRRAQRSSVAEEVEFSFLHMLLRDVAYRQIPRAERAGKHRLAAEWIEQLAGERVVDQAELIAHHYAAALKLARAAGDDTQALGARTRRFLILAGERAMRLDVAGAELFYRQALELAGEDDDDRGRVLAALASATQETGRLEEAIHLYEEAIAALRRRQDPLTLGSALASYQQALWRRGGAGHGAVAVAEAVELLERLPPGPELARAYSIMALMTMSGGRAAQCLDWAHRATDLAVQLDLKHLIVRTLQFRGMARVLLNDLGGLDDLRESLRLGHQVGAGIETAIAYVNLGEPLFWVEGAEPCLELYAEGIEFSERRGLGHNAYWLRLDKLRRLFDLGRWDELLAIADELVAWERPRGATQITTVAMIEKANVFVRRGVVRDAKELADRFLEAARGIDDPQIYAPALVYGALIEHAGGDTTAAILRIEEFENATRDRSPVYRANWIADAVRVCVGTDALPVATRLLTGLDVVAPRHVYGVRTARAALAESQEHLVEAVDGYAEAAGRWNEFGNVVEEAYALLGRGRCLRRLGRHEEAVEPLGAARRIFERLEARPLLVTVDALLAGMTPKKAGQSSASDTSLKPGRTGRRASSRASDGREPGRGSRR